MHDRETCTDCGAVSPETSARQTLTSSMGWRFMRERLPDGTLGAVWRCGKCWQAHKAQTPALEAESEEGPATGVRSLREVTRRIFSRRSR